MVRRFAVTLALLSSCALLLAGGASACTYATDGRPYEEALAAQFRGADAAFVGRPIAVVPLNGDEAQATRAIYVFLVERSLKRRLPKLVHVYAAIGGNLCGLQLRRGDRTGLMLDRRRGRWTSELIHQVAPRDLIRAARRVRRK
jgi:hypothetical protein